MMERLRRWLAPRSAGVLAPVAVGAMGVPTTSATECVVLQARRTTADEHASDILPRAATNGRATTERAPKVSRKRGEREFLVVGLGRFGTSLAKTLVAQGHDVLAIDVDMRRVQALSGELPQVVQIDATSIDSLQEIGCDHYDTAVVCIGYDFESNLLATVLLRRVGVRRIIAKARTRTQREILMQVGADEVILPEHEAGRRLAQRLSAVDFVDYLQLSPDISVVEMIAPQRVLYKSLAEANIRHSFGLTVLAVRRGEELQCNPPADLRILPGDELLVVGSLKDAQRFSD
jgi:trk system potassium uptake protein